MRFLATVASLALATNVVGASNWFSKAGTSKSGKTVVEKVKEAVVNIRELRSLLLQHRSLKLMFAMH